LKATSPGAAQKRRETDHAPFREVERLKENSLHQIERRAEWLKNLYLWLLPVHVPISNLRDRLIKLAFGPDRLINR
jgi:hypothetical protein